MAATPKPRKLSDGRIVWRVQFRLKPGATPTSETFDTIEGARAFARMVDKVGGAAARAARDTIETSDNDLTLDDLFEHYATSVATSATTGTVGKYRRNWDRYIKPRLGFIPAEGLSREMVEQWVTELRTTETRISLARREKDPGIAPEYLSPKTIKNAHGLLSSTLKHAVERDRITKNVAHALKLPRGRRKIEPVFLSQAEFATLLDKIEREYQPLVAFLAGTGLRWNEATALTGSDFQLDVAPYTVSVTKAWKYDASGAMYLGTAKTVASERTVTVPARLVTELVPLIVAAGPRGHVFKGRDGKALRHPWFLENVWYPARRAADLGRDPRIHDLRHTHASWLIAAGVSLPVIQRRLGHESIKTTVDTYGHLAPDSFAGAADAADLALAPALPQIEA